MICEYVSRVMTHQQQHKHRNQVH